MRLDARRALAALDILEAALTRKAAARKRRRMEDKLQAAMAKAFRAQGRAFVRELRAVAASYPAGTPVAESWRSWVASGACRIHTSQSAPRPCWAPSG